MLELYHSPDSRAFRCLWLLEEMGLEYKLHVMPFPPRVSSPDYLALNPLGTIPLLVDGEARLSESGAILEYLTFRCGPTPLLVGPDEAAFGAWLNWIHFGEATLTTPQTVTLRYAVFEPEERRQPGVASDYAAVFLDRLRAVAGALEGKAYLCADRFTAADISVAYALMLARFIGVDKQMPEVVRDYLARLQERPAYRAARAAQKVGT